MLRLSAAKKDTEHQALRVEAEDYEWLENAKTMIHLPAVLIQHCDYLRLPLLELGEQILVHLSPSMKISLNLCSVDLYDVKMHREELVFLKPHIG